MATLPEITNMREANAPALGVNSWLEDELYQQYRLDHKSVDDGWGDLFIQLDENAAYPAPEVEEPHAAAQNGAPYAATPVADPPSLEPELSAPPPENAAPAPVPEPILPPPVTVIDVVAKRPSAPAKLDTRIAGPSDQLVPIRGAAARIAENMTASLAIPVATSQRQIPVRVIEENRNLINKQRALQGRGKLSFTHFIAWAIVRAIKTTPGLNHAYAENGGEIFRIVRGQVNIGLAVDITAKDGSRTLKVPNIKHADGMTFAQFVAAYDDIVTRARSNKLQLSDFEGTTISLTNPGTVGTIGSVPRLMPGQGAIVAIGAIDFPAEFAAVSEEMRATLGISKTLMIACTYDHRIIQGAESGSFLAKIHQLLQGEENFYDAIFRDLKVPYRPIRWQVDTPLTTQQVPGANTDVAKEAAVIQIINAYRTRGHLLANTNPLGIDPGYHPDLDPASYGLTIWDLDRIFLAGTIKAPSGAIARNMRAYEPLRAILDRLRTTYCGSIGIEYMHIPDPEQKQWLQERMETTQNSWKLDESTRTRILNRLIQAEEFEHFLQARFVGQKRFGLEGLESTIVALDEILECSLTRMSPKPSSAWLTVAVSTFWPTSSANPWRRCFPNSMANPIPKAVQGSGDVKYHLGAAGVYTSHTGREIVVSVAFNPSHLEAVDPVVEGCSSQARSFKRHRASSRSAYPHPWRCRFYRPRRRRGGPSTIPAGRLQNGRHHSHRHQ